MSRLTEAAAAVGELVQVFLIEPITRSDTKFIGHHLNGVC